MIVIAHNIRSLHNVGAIFRSCDAFGVERLYLTGFTGTPPRLEIAKTALGSEDRVVWEKPTNVSEAIEAVRRDGYTVVALENGVGARALAMRSMELSRPCCPRATKRSKSPCQDKNAR